MAKLREIAMISQGLSRVGHGAGTRRGEWFVKIAESGDISDDGWLSIEGLREVGVARSHRTERHLLRPFDVLVTARAGAVQVALVPPRASRTVAGVTLLVVRPRDPAIGMGHWVWYFLTSTFGRAELTKRLVVSATMKSLSARSLGDIEVPIPPSGDMERIARLVEASEEAHASAIRAANLRRGTLQDGIVGSLILGKNPFRWRGTDAADQPGTPEQAVAGR